MAGEENKVLQILNATVTLLSRDISELEDTVKGEVKFAAIVSAAVVLPLYAGLLCYGIGKACIAIIQPAQQFPFYPQQQQPLPQQQGYAF